MFYILIYVKCCLGALVAHTEFNVMTMDISTAGEKYEGFIRKPFG